MKKKDPHHWQLKAHAFDFIRYRRAVHRAAQGTAARHAPRGMASGSVVDMNSVAYSEYLARAGGQFNIFFRPNAETDPSRHAADAPLQSRFIAGAPNVAKRFLRPRQYLGDVVLGRG